MNVVEWKNPKGNKSLFDPKKGDLGKIVVVCNRLPQKIFAKDLGERTRDNSPWNCNSKT